MQFRESSSIYLQIADHICERILLQQWATEERIPSVRELAAQLEVNPNTVMRTYEFLQQQGIIYNQRGIGYFVAPDGVKKVRAYRKTEFLENDLPGLFRSLFLLGIDMGELEPLYEKYKQEHFPEASLNQTTHENKQ
ncbi:GntR family transcriptional regulator [Paraflavisolibacter sp. H34]|uniref:GntR family transcriptional regulator n=1 Tax=Huijunlia imazamoxiresistens TaxID=3127457 RepID=UPI003019A55D